jgi:transcriptional regulator with XRE-family HTH domain
MITEKDCCAVTLCALVLSGTRMRDDMLSYYRQKEGLSPHQAAYRIGVSMEYYEQLEAGKMPITSKIAHRLGMCFNENEGVFYGSAYRQ